MNELPLLLSIPHSGEDIPSEVTWLSDLDEPTLMRDVDRYVDDLYQPVIQKESLSAVITFWHRYVVDLNRKEDEFDAQAVLGAIQPVGAHPKGLHWSVTTQKETLIPEPMSMELHDQLVKNYYQPFHSEVQKRLDAIKERAGLVYHLDLHSMPSLGTSLHPDPGERRAEIVVSDYHGHSSCPEFKDLVMKSYQDAGFQVAYNWPYVGGGITQRYGNPDQHCHTIQVELNRSLYMDEATKKKVDAPFKETQEKLELAIKKVMEGLPSI